MQRKASTRLLMERTRADKACTGKGDVEFWVDRQSWTGWKLSKSCCYFPSHASKKCGPGPKIDEGSLCPRGTSLTRHPMNLLEAAGCYWRLKRWDAHKRRLGRGRLGRQTTRRARVGRGRACGAGAWAMREQTVPMQWEKTIAPMRATKMQAMRSSCVMGRMSPAEQGRLSESPHATLSRSLCLSLRLPQPSLPSPSQSRFLACLLALPACLPVSAPPLMSSQARLEGLHFPFLAHPGRRPLYLRPASVD